MLVKMAPDMRDLTTYIEMCDFRAETDINTLLVQLNLISWNIHANYNYHQISTAMNIGFVNETILS